MTKLFLKTFYYLFLWILLLVNLFMFFGISSPLAAAGLDTADLQDSYFGVSSLIECFKYMPNTPLGQAASKTEELLNKISGFMTEQFSKGLSDFGANIFNIFESDNFGDSIIAILLIIPKLLIMSARILFSIGGSIAALVVLIAYVFLMVLNLLTFIGYMLGAMAHNSVPTYPSMDIQPYIMESVNSVLTSLRACC